MSANGAGRLPWQPPSGKSSPEPLTELPKEFKVTASHVRTLAASLDEPWTFDEVPIVARLVVPLEALPSRRPGAANLKSNERRAALRELAQGRIGYAEFARRTEGLEDGDFRALVSELARDKGGAAMTDAQRNELVRHLVHDASAVGTSLDEDPSAMRSQAPIALKALCEVLQPHLNPRHRDGLIAALAGAPARVFTALHETLYRTGTSDTDFQALFRGCILHLPVQEAIKAAQVESTALGKVEAPIRQDHAHALGKRMDDLFPVELKSSRVESLAALALDCLVHMPADCAPERLALGFASVGRAVHWRVEGSQALEAAWSAVEKVAQSRSVGGARAAIHGLASGLLDAPFKEPSTDMRLEVLGCGLACIVRVARHCGHDHVAAMGLALLSSVQPGRFDFRTANLRSNFLQPLMKTLGQLAALHALALAGALGACLPEAARKSLRADLRAGFQRLPGLDAKALERAFDSKERPHLYDAVDSSDSQTTSRPAAPPLREVERKHLGREGKRERVDSETAVSRTTSDAKAQDRTVEVARRGCELVDEALAVHTLSSDSRRQQFQAIGQWLHDQPKRHKGEMLDQVLQHLYTGPAGSCEPLLRAATRGLCSRLCASTVAPAIAASRRDRILHAAARHLGGKPQSVAAVVHEVAAGLDAWEESATHAHGIAQLVCHPALPVDEVARVQMFAALLEAGSISPAARDALELQLSMTNLGKDLKQNLLALLVRTDPKS